jgi:hypothetical protein
VAADPTTSAAYPVATSPANAQNEPDPPNNDPASTQNPANPALTFKASNTPPKISDLVIGSQTAYAGGVAITLSEGTIVNLLPGGQSAVIGGVTQSLTPITGGNSVENGYLVGSQTLEAGGSAITISGSVLSLLPGGSNVILDGTTTAVSVLSGATSTILTASAATGEIDLGGVIASVGGFASVGVGGSVDGDEGGNGALNTTLSGVIVETGSPSSVFGYNGTMFTGMAASKLGKLDLHTACCIALGVVLVGTSIL